MSEEVKIITSTSSAPSNEESSQSVENLLPADNVEEGVKNTLKEDNQPNEDEEEVTAEEAVLVRNKGVHVDSNKSEAIDNSCGLKTSAAAGDSDTLLDDFKLSKANDDDSNKVHNRRTSVNSDFTVVIETDTFIAYQVVTEKISSRPHVVNCFAITLKFTNRDCVHLQNGDIFEKAVFVMASYDKRSGPDFSSVRLMFMRKRFIQHCIENVFEHGDNMQFISEGIKTIIMN